MVKLSQGPTPDANARDRVEWRLSDRPVEYESAISWMEDRVEALRAGSTGECVWLLQHPHLYTAGTSANPQDLLSPLRLPVFVTGRGGQYTYHGPGQRVGYVMLDLQSRGRDVRAFVFALEDWIIETLSVFGVAGARRQGRVGVWVERPDLGREDKIAAIGVRVRRWVTFHGMSLNVNPELEHYAGIVPCGVRDHGVTSLADLGVQVSMEEVDATLRRTFPNHF